MPAIYIAADELKKTLKGYTPAESEKFHRESAKMADKELEAILKMEGSPKEVLLLCGGAASGKTELCDAYLRNNNCIIFDGTLPTSEGAKIKIRKIKKAGKMPVIAVVFPDDLKRSYKAFFGRDRKYGKEHFFRTHSGSRKTALWIAQEFPEVEIQIYRSIYRENDLIFKNPAFKNHDELIDFLMGLQHTESGIKKLVS